MRVIDLAGRARPVLVEVEVSPAYEMLLSLATFSQSDEIDTFTVGPAWFERVAALASPELSALIDIFSRDLGKMWCLLLGFAYDGPEPKGIPSFLDRLEAIDPLELRLHLLKYYAPRTMESVGADTILAAAHGDSAAQKFYLDNACDEEAHEALQQFLSVTPHAAKNSVTAILRRWYDEVFRNMEGEIMPALERDAETKRRLIGTVAPERLIDLATNGLQYTAEAGIRRVLLIPTFAYRPWVLISEYRDARILCYPVADESLSADSEPSPSRLVLIYKALADERRLQVLRKLAVEQLTLQEMADFLGIGKSLMHHHIAALRAAGLVRVKLEHDKRYELRLDAVAGVGDLLTSYLAGGAIAGHDDTEKIKEG